ncbi:MAG TPA: hypothetical protein VJW51_11110 [Candidatus Acidoferrales bacterium]|nr:hypothetical protein [Candidatus Acidoferrales bacterium]
MRQPEVGVANSGQHIQNLEGDSMKLRILSIMGLALLFASAAGAQTKVTGKQQCPKDEVVGTADAGDKPGHSLQLIKSGTCTWATPMEMEGGKSKDGSSVALVEITTTRATSSGTYVGNMENGDKFFVSFRDSAAVKDGKPGNAKGTWAYTGGTGKLKGITGKGTYTVTNNADGTSVVDVEGEYAVPAAAPKKAAAKKSS